MQKISTVLMGKKIRDEREKQGLTQDELGELLFMDSSSVCRMEKRKNDWAEQIGTCSKCFEYRCTGTI